jgi:hypothetical protein
LNPTCTFPIAGSSGKAARAEVQSLHSIRFGASVTAQRSRRRDQGMAPRDRPREPHDLSHDLCRPVAVQFSLAPRCAELTPPGSRREGSLRQDLVARDNSAWISSRGTRSVRNACSLLCIAQIALFLQGKIGAPHFWISKVEHQAAVSSFRPFLSFSSSVSLEAYADELAPPGSRREGRDLRPNSPHKRASPAPCAASSEPACALTTSSEQRLNRDVVDLRPEPVARDRCDIALRSLQPGCLSVRFIWWMIPSVRRRLSRQCELTPCSKTPQSPVRTDSVFEDAPVASAN